MFFQFSMLLLLLLVGCIFSGLGLKVVLARRPLVISSLWLRFVMLVSIIPILYRPVMNPHAIHAINFLPAAMWLLILAMIWKQTGGYSIFGIANPAFRESLVETLHKLNVPFHEDMTGITIVSEKIKLETMALSNGVARIRVRDQSHVAWLQKLVAALKDYYATTRVKTTLTFSLFYCLFGLIVVVFSVWIASDIFDKETNKKFTFDEKKPAVSQVSAAVPQPVPTNAALNTYFIAQYIRARESFSFASLADNYNIVRLMSEPSRVYTAFVSEADPNNQASNAARLGGVGSRRIAFKSITFAQPQVAEVHFVIHEKTGYSATPVDYNKVAFVGFEYVKMNLTTDERFLNTPGFRVFQYKLEDDRVKNPN